MAKNQITFTIETDESNAVGAEGCRVFTATSPNGSLCILTVTPVNVDPTERKAVVKKRDGSKETVEWDQQSLIGTGFVKPRIGIGEHGYTVSMKINRQRPRKEAVKTVNNGRLVSI